MILSAGNPAAPNAASQHPANADSKSRRRTRGARAYAAGRAAEDQVARRYQRNGHVLLHARWRGTSGEIDLLFQCGDEIVSVEVKSSATHAQAAAHLGPRQIARWRQTTEEFVGTQPLQSLTPIRMEVALVDRQGRIEVIENALMGL